MKQLLQRLDTGDTMLVEAPQPAATGPALVARTRASVISAGTERMLVSFGRSNLIEKARQQPDKVKQVLEKIRTDGLAPTVEAVRSKLSEPIPLGYCNAGIVEQVGDRSGGFRVGDRVVTNGPHAEVVRVPHTLAARIPQEVSFDTAAFTPLAAIGLQGLRLAEPTIGETFVVYGLGLVGLLTVQVARSAGCRVVGVDLDEDRLALAEELGAVAVPAQSATLVDEVRALTGGVGADAVLLTLASSSDEPVHLAAEMTRKKGRLVLVGVTGLDLRRDDFYEKELSLTVSCSYGAGRYDPTYEDKARDYPLPYVRWTEQRNFEAVLDMMRDGRLRTEPLVTHRYDFDQATAAYDLLAEGQGDYLGILLEYPDSGEAEVHPRTIEIGPGRIMEGAGVAGVIGAGGFTTRTLLPALQKTGAALRTIASSGGSSSATAARKFGFEKATTDVAAVLDDPSIDTVFITTRHDSHADFVVKALDAGKHVFVEKPLALTLDDLDRIEEAVAASDRLLMVGFNRRFAPHARELEEDLATRAGPLSLVITVNAGALPDDHWVQDPATGGGRIVGEACHWIDLARFLADAPIVDSCIVAAKRRDGATIEDIAHLSLEFEDGSTAVVSYLANGARSYPKERVEAHFDGKSVIIDNWRKIRKHGIRDGLFSLPRRLDKGHEAELARWMDAVRTGGVAPIPLPELLQVSRVAVEAAEAVRAGRR